MNIDNLSDEQVKILESQKKEVNHGFSGLHPDRVTMDNLSDEQLRILETQKKEVNYESSGLHPDRVTMDNLSDEQLRILEAQKKEFNYEPSGLHPDRVSIDNLNDEQVRIFEAMVSERKKEDMPHKEYFKNLVDNLEISDEKEFESAINRGMQSNSIMNTFILDLMNKLSIKTNELKLVDKNDKNKIDNVKLEIEKAIIVYEKFLYKLKENNWNFQTVGCNLESMKIPENITNDLWQLQKKFDINFNLLIPKDLGDYYGHQFERDGKLLPGINLMYDDLLGKEVNWHQVLIYKENELTPYQRYIQRREEKLKEFEQVRQNEISNTLANVQEKSSTSSIRR